MNLTICFNELGYKHAIDYFETGELREGTDFCGNVNVGALCFEFILREEIGRNFDCCIYVLGEDGDGAFYNSIPYIFYDGFCIPVEDTYAGTLCNIINMINEVIEKNEFLKQKSEDPEYSWSNGVKKKE